MHIGIVGAGLMGRLTAWFLLKDAKRLGADCRLSLFDKDSKTHGDAAAFTAAGMLCPYAELEASEPLVFSLGMHALSLWPDIADAMPHDIGFRQRGSLVVAHSNDISDWHHFRHTLDHKLKPFETEQGASHQQTLEQNALQQREPSLSQHFQRALWLPQEACLHSSETLRALQIALDNAGIEWHENTIADHVSAQTVRCGQSEYHFDTVIDCRGLGAKVDQPSLRGVRGELIALYAPEVTIRHMVRLMHPRYQLYLVPQMQAHHYLLGATQIESDDRSPVTVRSALELLSSAYSLHPGFAEAHILELRQNCRPAFNDNLPRINASTGLIQINGLFRHGYLIAPSLAEAVSAHVFSDAEAINARFSHLIESTADAA